MATIRNTAGEDRWIPIAGAVVEDNDTFEIEDELFYQLEFGVDLEVVEPPTIPDPRIEQAQQAAAADAAAEQERQDALAEQAAKRAEVAAAQEAERADLDAAMAYLENEFDPSDHNVDEVLVALSVVSQSARERIIAAERAGKARVSIVGEPAVDTNQDQE